MAVEHWESQRKIIGCHFAGSSDHESLKWLFGLQEPKHRVVWSIEVLSEFDFEIEYRPRKKHGNADALSCCSNSQDCCCPLIGEDELQCKSCKKCLKQAEQMLGDLPAYPPQSDQIEKYAGGQLVP